MKKFYTEKLENGLTLLGEHNPQNKSAAIGFFVKTGARDETKKEAGVSHFLEHMMFKGTATRSAIDISFQLGNLGAQANAYTSEENTVYYAGVLPEYFKQMQELLSDMLRPALDINEFTTEKKVILEEIALYQDRPNFYLFEHAMADYFAEHQAGQSVLGSQESVGAISRDEMKDYFDRRYSPSNMVLVASGNFDWNQFVSDAQKQCGAWPNFQATRQTTAYARKPIYKEYFKKNLNMAHAMYLAQGPSAQDQERYAFSVLSMIVGDAIGSRMYWQLVDKGLAESAAADADEKDGTGCFYAYISTEVQNLDKVSKIVKEILATINEFNDQDLERAKTKLCSRIVMHGELPMGRLMSLGTEWNYLQKITDLSQVIAEIKAIGRPQIEQALKKFPIKEISEFRLLPQLE